MEPEKSLQSAENDRFLQIESSHGTQKRSSRRNQEKLQRDSKEGNKDLSTESGTRAEKLGNGTTNRSNGRNKKRLSKAEQELKNDAVSETENDEDGVVRCICGFTNDGEMMIQCEECNVWQHTLCMGIRNEKFIPDKYYCEGCREEDHPYINQMPRGVVLAREAELWGTSVTTSVRKAAVAASAALSAIVSHTASTRHKTEAIFLREEIPTSIRNSSFKPRSKGRKKATTEEPEFKKAQIHEADERLFDDSSRAAKSRARNKRSRLSSQSTNELGAEIKHPKRRPERQSPNLAKKRSKSSAKEQFNSDTETGYELSEEKSDLYKKLAPFSKEPENEDKNLSDSDSLSLIGSGKRFPKLDKMDILDSKVLYSECDSDIKTRNSPRRFNRRVRSFNSANPNTMATTATTTSTVTAGPDEQLKVEDLAQANDNLARNERSGPSLIATNSYYNSDLDNKTESEVEKKQRTKKQRVNDSPHVSNNSHSTVSDALMQYIQWRQSQKQYSSKRSSAVKIKFPSTRSTMDDILRRSLQILEIIMRKKEDLLSEQQMWDDYDEKHDVKAMLSGSSYKFESKPLASGTRKKLSENNKIIDDKKQNLFTDLNQSQLCTITEGNSLLNCYNDKPKPNHILNLSINSKNKAHELLKTSYLSLPSTPTQAMAPGPHTFSQSSTPNPNQDPNPSFLRLPEDNGKQGIESVSPSPYASSNKPTKANMESTIATATAGAEEPANKHADFSESANSLNINPCFPETPGDNSNVYASSTNNTGAMRSGYETSTSSINNMSAAAIAGSNLLSINMGNRSHRKLDLSGLYGNLSPSQSPGNQETLESKNSEARSVDIGSSKHSSFSLESSCYADCGFYGITEHRNHILKMLSDIEALADHISEFRDSI